MKPNRSRIATIPMVVLAIFIGFLLCSCATTGDGKVAEPDTEAPGQGENQSAAVAEASSGNPEASEEPVVETPAEVEPALAEVAVEEPVVVTPAETDPDGVGLR